MQTNYVIILDFCGGYLNIIHLTEEEKKNRRSMRILNHFSAHSKINMDSGLKTASG